MPTPHVRYFTGCFANGVGQIDVYLTVVGGAVCQKNGTPNPPGTDFGTVDVPALLWLDGVYNGSQGSLLADPAQTMYYRRSAGGVESSTDHLSWSSAAARGYPSRLLLWPPPRETSSLAPTEIGGLATCSLGLDGYPDSEGSAGPGHLVVAPFSISFVTLNLLRGDVGVPYGDVSGFLGLGQYLSAVGYAGDTSMVFTVTSGILPPGLSLVGGHVIQGTPTTNGTYPVTLRATDSETYYHDQAFAIRIGPLVTTDVGTPVPPSLPPPVPDPSDPDAPNAIAAGSGYLIGLGFSAVEGAGLPIHVPNPSTDGGWGCDRIDLKVRREGTA